MPTAVQTSPCYNKCNAQMLESERPPEKIAGGRYIEAGPKNLRPLV